MDRTVKYKLISLIVTLLIFVATIAWLILVHLSDSGLLGVCPPDQSDSAPLLLADEYVEVEMIPPVETEGGSDAVEPEGASAPPAVAHDRIDQGAPAESPAPLITSTQSSPVQAKPAAPVKPSGPSQAEIDAAKAKEKAQKEASEQIHSKVAFGKTPGATGSGNADKGEGSGDSAEKSTYEGTGSGSVGGRGIRITSRIKSTRPGKVVVRITVSPEGKVTGAEITSANIADPAVREQCVKAARGARIDKSDKGIEERGTITFIFK